MNEIMLGADNDDPGFAGGGSEFWQDGTIKTAGDLVVSGTVAIGPLALPANVVTHIEVDDISKAGLVVHLADSQSGAIWPAILISSNDNFANNSGIAFATDSIGGLAGQDSPGMYLIRTSGTEADLKLYAQDADSPILLMTLDGSANLANFPLDISVDGTINANGNAISSTGAITYTVSSGVHSFAGGNVSIEAAVEPTLQLKNIDGTIEVDQILGAIDAGAVDDDVTQLQSARILFKASEDWAADPFSGTYMEVWTTETGTNAAALAATFENDGDFTVEGQFVAKGTINTFGQEGVAQGTLGLRGSPTGSTGGGLAVFWVADDHDAVISSYRVGVNNDDLEIGPITDLDLFRIHGADQLAEFTNAAGVKAVVVFLAETTTPTPIADCGALYTKADNGLYFQDGSGAEHTVHLPAFSSLAFNMYNTTSEDTTLTNKNEWYKFVGFGVLGTEGDTGLLTGSVGNDEFTVNAGGAGHYAVTYSMSIDITGTNQRGAMSLRVELATQKLITGATNADPIVITTVATHNLVDGDGVTISGATGNTNANGDFWINVTGPTTFELYELDGSTRAGNGAYGGSGRVDSVMPLEAVSRRYFATIDLGSKTKIGCVDLKDGDVVNLVFANLTSAGKDAEVESITFALHRVEV